MSRYERLGTDGHGNEVYAHIHLAEQALGRKLKGEECVHHADGDSHNNEPTNLVICPDQKYHKLLHVRLNAYKVCGNPDHRKCVRCGAYDAVENMAIHSRKSMDYIHVACRRAADNARYAAKKAGLL